MAYTQDDRVIAIDTPLGKDALLLVSMAVQESISRLFRISAQLYSKMAPSISPRSSVNACRISLNLADGSKRYFNGFVSRFAQVGLDKRFTHYHAEIVPWLWFLTSRADCRIFQNMTIPDIVDESLQGSRLRRFQECSARRFRAARILRPISRNGL